MLSKLTLLVSILGVAKGSGPCTGSFAPNPKNCSSYFQCVNGKFVLSPCPAGLEWNVKKSYCDWPAEAGCSRFNQQLPQPLKPLPTQRPYMGGGESLATFSNAALISPSEFNCAALTKEGQPNGAVYQGFIKSLPHADIHDKTEAAKFLAHEIWETVGFQFTREQYCMNNMDACARAYPNTQGKAGAVYYGRGMLQLTWDYNYAAASKALYHDNRLIENPDMVADDPEVGCATAAWFWKANVHAVSGTFGGTLKAINGALECDGGPNAENRILRFNHYKQVLSCLNLASPDEGDGYCHA